MRISGDPDDPDYLADSRGVAVLLDGVVVRHCISADDVAGLVTRHVELPDGTIQADSDGWAIETVTGAVKIILPGHG